MEVVNRGRTADEEEKQARGKAKPASPDSVGHLRVSFFGPFYSDYIVFALDTADYSYALVSGGTHEYLWILSRTPTMPEELRSRVVDIARDKGFPVEQLLRVPQEAPEN